MTLSIVIPAYNESPRLPQTLAAIAGFFGESTPLHLEEVLVVDDGSADDTVVLAESWGTRLPVRVLRLLKNSGKGAAVREGMLAATGDLLLMYDADGATPINEVIRLWGAMEQQGAQIAIGSRVDSRSGVSMQHHRRLIGRIYHALCRGLHPGIRDAACGCKLFRRESAQEIFALQTIDRFAFDVEILSLAIGRGMKIVELPVQWSAIERSKVRLVQDGVQMFGSVLSLYWKKFMKKN
ncbi:glycosyltransferase family 2 protein [Candidatus Peribacteria bacterium]|nr:glycosyltransferase family 2 protein [Candidatus Peribacteria bacterium]